MLRLYIVITLVFSCFLLSGLSYQGWGYPICKFINTDPYKQTFLYSMVGNNVLSLSEEFALYRTFFYCHIVSLLSIQFFVITNNVYWRWFLKCFVSIFTCLLGLFIFNLYSFNCISLVPLCVVGVILLAFVVLTSVAERFFDIISLMLFFMLGGYLFLDFCYTIEFFESLWYIIVAYLLCFYLFSNILYNFNIFYTQLKKIVPRFLGTSKLFL